MAVKSAHRAWGDKKVDIDLIAVKAKQSPMVSAPLLNELTDIMDVAASFDAQLVEIDKKYR